MLGSQATKNIVEVDREEWMTGRDLEINSEYRGYVLIKSGRDFLGCGKMTSKGLLNYFPKSRRI